MSTNVQDIHEDHHHTPSGLMRWITTTNHKDIDNDLVAIHHSIK